MLFRNVTKNHSDLTKACRQVAKYMDTTIILYMGCLLLTGCINYQCKELSRPRPTSPDKVALVDKSFITDQPCQPPCWQNLVPGVSTGDEVVTTLGMLPFVDAATITRQKYEPSSEGELVTWKSSLSDGNGFMRLDQGGILNSISVWLEYDLSVRQVIDQRGDPEVFEINPDGPNCGDVSLIWFGRGFGLGTQLSMAAENGQLLTPETLVRVVFYYPEEERKPGGRYFPWGGYELVDIDLVWKR